MPTISRLSASASRFHRFLVGATLLALLHIKPLSAQDSDKKPEPGPFPRRMLAISVINYPYANPILYGQTPSDRDLHKVVTVLADRWRIPKDQVYELTDGPLDGGKARGESAPAPLKDVIRKTIARFCETCRSQDRIIFLFAGHAIEKEGVAHLVPLEGDIDEPESLIPLSEVYDQLGKCKAQEKLVIWDVCRFDEKRSTERPIFGAMTPALEKALHSAPPSVSVWTACSKGEHSYELAFDVEPSSGREVWGSFFLSQFLHAASAGALSKKKDEQGPTPDEPLPAKALVAFVTKSTSQAADKIQRSPQTPKFTSAAIRDPIPYDPKEALPARFEFPAGPKTVARHEITAILDEIRMPPLFQVRKEDCPPFPFLTEKLKDYQSDGITAEQILKTPDKYPLRAVVLQVLGEIRKMQQKETDEALNLEIRGMKKEEMKKAV